jgi:glutamyl-tRNA reductase
MLLINRTKSKADAIAKPLGLRVAHLENLETELSNTDLLIVATGAKHPTVKKEHLHQISKDILLLDLSVPRNIAPDVAQLSHVGLIDMDQLNSIQDETLDMRKKNIPKARTIINLHKNEFYEWVQLRSLSPTIQALREKLHSYRIKELEQQKNRLSQEELEKADKLTTSVVNKIVNQATEYIKSKHRNADDMVKLVKEMFKLDS